jgi:hypothetical protein
LSTARWLPLRKINSPAETDIPMKPIPQFEELAIAPIAPNLNPTHFTPEFLL